MIKAQELRNHSIEELQALYFDACKALFDLVNELRLTKKLEQPHTVRMKRKEIARILTVLREKELAQES